MELYSSDVCVQELLLFSLSFQLLNRKDVAPYPGILFGLFGPPYFKKTSIKGQVCLQTTQTPFWFDFSPYYFAEIIYKENKIIESEFCIFLKILWIIFLSKIENNG